MKVWKKATGILKDKSSIWFVKFSKKGSPWSNPHLEKIIIKATSHDEQHIDYKNVQRVFKWLRTSPLYLRPLVWALSMRMQKTKSWVVALKGLMLIHGIFCTDLPVVQKMGRLPFDLSNFKDEHMNPSKAWCFNAFVRSYFAYLDQRSSFFACNSSHVNKNNNKKKVEEENTLMEELDELQKMQYMIDLLMQIKPGNMNVGHDLILEAMDCVIVEVFDVYSKFCNRIARVLLRIYDIGGKMEAGIALKVLQKALVQGDQLSLYFEFCSDIGILNASQVPKIEKISEEDIQDLEKIISSGGGDSAKKSPTSLDLEGNDDEKAIVLRDCLQQKYIMKTVITFQWEVFEDDVCGGNSVHLNGGDGAKAITITSSNNPFEESFSNTLVPYQVLPDLISL